MTQENANPSNSLIVKFLSGIWHFHRKLIISIILLLAIILLVFRGLALYLESNPHIVQNYIESQLQTPVTFATIQARVNPFFLSVSMSDFVIKDENETSLLNFSSASIRLNMPLSFIRGQGVINRLTLDGFSTSVRRHSSGEISIGGLKLPAPENTKTARPAYLLFLNQSDFMISNSQVFFSDEQQEYPSVYVSDINFEMNNSRTRHQLSFQASLNKSDTKVDLRLDFEGRIEQIKKWNGLIYASLENLSHQNLLDLLEEDVVQIENYQINDIKAGVKIWSEISSGSLQSIKGELLVDDAKLRRLDSEQAIRFDHLKTNFKLARYYSARSGLLQKNVMEEKANDWMVDLYDLNLKINSRPISEKHIRLSYRENSSEVQLYVNQLILGEFSHVTSFFSPEDFNKNVFQVLKPKGRLDNIIATFKLKSLDMPVDITHYQVQLDVTDFGINAFKSLPKIRNFSSKIIFNERMGRATIDSHEMKLHLKSLFRDSWPITQLNGVVYWQKEEDAWLLGGDDLKVKNPHLNANADLKLWLNENGQNYMDLTGFYHDANVEYVSYYLPVAKMSKGLVKWLDNAIISGWGTDGGVVFRGNLRQFPYAEHTGSMDIVFNTRDVVLNYKEGWPKLTDIKAQVQFTEQGMLVESNHSKMLSAVSNNTRVAIERYLKPVLRVKSDLKGRVDDGKQFLQQSRLVSDDVLAIIDAKDNIGINLDLTIPMKGGTPDTKLKISLNDADYYPLGFERKDGLVSHLKGNVFVHNKAINANQLTASIMGQAANVNIKTTQSSSSSSSKSKTDPNINVTIDTKASMKQLKQYELLPLSLKPLFNQISGESNINLMIDIPNAQRPLSFDITSTLQGIESRLPAPFSKKVNVLVPFELSFLQHNKSADLNIDLPDMLSLALQLDTSAEEKELLKGNVHLGRGQAKLPKENTLKITGSLKELPLKDWQAVLSASSDKSSFGSSRSGSSRVDSSSAGSLRVDSSKTGSPDARSSQKRFIPVQVAMKELNLPALSKDDDQKGTETPKSRDSLIPEQFPLINGSIDSVKLGKTELGKFTIQTSRIDKGIEFDAINLKGGLLSFAAKGKWQHWSKIPKIDLEGELDVPSMGNFLTQLGYGQLMRNGETQASAYVSWSGGPEDFSKKNIEGILSIDVKRGAYLEGKPGKAGRVLGLLNMNALARRISLDFSDVSGKGFEFDSIKGDFRLKDGNAHTDNFRMTAPSTKILLTGRIGMAAEDFDQQVTVIPEISATLPIAGAAVAGPAGAAVVWVGQKLIGDQINKVTAFGYTVTGSWHEPVIKKVNTDRTALSRVTKIFNLDEETDAKVTEQANESYESDLP